MADGGRQSSALDQAAAERLLSTGEKLQWQHVRDYDRESKPDKFGSKTSHLTVVGAGWATIVGGSVAMSILDPAKRHLLLSHRLIHARIVAQWATVGALIAAGVGEKFVSMYDTVPTHDTARDNKPVASYSAQRSPKGEDWTKL